MMPRSHRNLICDTIDDIASLTALSQVGDRFAEAAANLGFISLGINLLPPPAEDADPVIVIEKAPQGFRDLYIHERFYAVDHIAAHAKAAYEPFRFADAPYAAAETQRHERFMQALKTYDMGKGVIVPIGRPGNMPACVWLAGREPELHDDAILATQMISLFAASKAQALSKSSQGGARSSILTKREREVLQWISEGKSAWEIGEILCIAKRTVDEHAQSACRKLNAANRTQAVVVALRERLIAL